MQDSILSSLFSKSQYQHFQKSWPEKSVVEHDNLTRLPALFSHPLLQSIESLTQAYRGRVLAADRRHSDSMTPISEDGASLAVQEGLTIYMDDLTPLLPEASEFLQQLENELCIPLGSARIGAFVSPPGNGAPCHYDVNEVISVQLVGSKQFNIAPVEQIPYPYGMQYSPSTVPFDDLYPQMATGAPDYTDQNFDAIKMQPGSVLYMPRGTWHHTLAEEASLAVSIILHPPTQLDRLVEQLTSTLLQDRDWRRPYYGKQIDKQRAEALHVKLPKVIKNLVAREKNSQAPSKIITRRSRFFRTPSVEVSISNQQTHCDIHIAAPTETGVTHTSKLTTPAHTGEVIRWISERDGPFTGEQLAQQFPAAPWDLLVEILDVAQQSMLVRFLWFDPLK